MIESTKIEQGSFFEVTEGVWGMKDIFVNVYFVSIGDGWVLVDAGLKTSYEKIKKVAAQLFGENVAPNAIVLTHGHFDHVGALELLLKDWNVPVYAHHLEMAYLTGKSEYPPADSSVGGGLMSAMADLYPNDPIDLSGTVKSLPFSQQIPALPEWKYIHTPGHAPGHISLWRERDKLLIAGDAFVTTKQESVFSVATQLKVLSGPPKYFTYDWELAKRSVEELAALKPEIVAAGHGKPMYGEQMQQDLAELAANFDRKARPSKGRYVSEPAVTNQYGVVSLPEERMGFPEKIAIIAGFVAIAGAAYAIVSDQVRKGRLASRF